MKSKIELSGPERVTLQQLSLNHRHRDIRALGTGLLMLARGLTPQITSETGCSVRDIYNWIHTWHDLDIAGLLGGHVGGRSLAMTPEMISTAVEAACSESLTLARMLSALKRSMAPCHARWKHWGIR